MTTSTESSVKQPQNEVVNGRSLTSHYQTMWDRRSSVRTRPLKLIDFTQDGYFFSVDKQPLLLHPEVIAKGESVKYNILLHSFKKYLTDIITLEIKMIDAACRKIIDEPLAVAYKDQIKINAYTVMIDEYYHVYIARCMLHEINQQFPDLKTYEYPVSDANNSVAKIKSCLDPKYHDMFHIIAVCIFETTLVRELIDFFNADNIHPSIRYYVNDHMNDESKHYAFFYDLLCYTWTNMPEDFQVAIGQQLANFIQLYLHIDSDRLFYIDLCASVFDDKQKAESIVNELYKGFVVSPDIPIVKNVINVLKKSNIIEHESVKSGFSKLGWKL